MPTLCLWIFSIKAEQAVVEPRLGLLGMAAEKIQLDFQGRKKGLIPKEKWTSWLLYYCFSSLFFSAAAPLSLVEPQVLQGFFFLAWFDLQAVFWVPGWPCAQLLWTAALWDTCWSNSCPFLFPFQGIFYPALARKHLQAVRETSLRQSLLLGLVSAVY